MNQQQLSQATPLCNNPRCEGQPVVTDSGIVYQPYLMKFTEFTPRKTAEYVCPNCGRAREIKLKRAGKGFEPARTSSDIDWLLILFFLLMVLVGCPTFF